MQSTHLCNQFKLHASIAIALVLFLLLVQGARSYGSEKTQKEVAGAKYKASYIHKLFLGKNYRDLWTAPVEVEVLDLEKYSGGLHPVMRVGGKQTLGLALKGADGKSYTFRGVDKDPATFLPPSFQDTLAEHLVKDQTSADHPAAAVTVPPIAQAAGILHTEPKLVVMPDDPTLGEYREAFAGVLGTLEEYPNIASDAHSGTFGAIEIISSEEMWDRRLANPQNSIDSLAFLRARLVDILLGDWDRHQGQWRWAKIPDKPGWQPIPEDRDHVFCSYGGLVLSFARTRYPQLVSFKASYPNLEGLTWNGREIDRKILTDLELQTWQSTAEEIQNGVTDDVIEKAVRQMPVEYIDLSGERIIKLLKKRRTKLLDEAIKFYRHLAGEVDVHCTKRDDYVIIHREQNGDVDVSVSLSASGKKAGDFYFQRKFHPKETREVRIYLHAGNDVVVTSGGKLSAIGVRVIGGDGSDTVDDSNAGGIYFADSSGDNKLVKGPGSTYDPVPYNPPEKLSRKHVVMSGNPLLGYRDWGRYTSPQFYPGFSSDIGLFLGAGIISTGYGFRYFPYSDSHRILIGYATIAGSGIFDYRGDFRKPNSSLSSTFSFLVSGLQFLRFYGFGNETSGDMPEGYYKIRQRVVSISPALHYEFSPSLELYGGLQFKYSAAKEDHDTLLGQLQPYGYKNFSQVGFRLGFKWDTRNPLNANASGFRADAEGFVCPKAASVESSFSGLEGSVAGYISLAQPLILALSVGGKKVFGTIPYTEAAYIGGSSTVRGLPNNRFAGTASLYGRLELRWRLGKAIFFVPGEYGILCLADAGRVFAERESSVKWHPAYGGGIFFSILDLSTVFTLSVARSEEWTAVYIKAGFSF